MNTQQHTQMKIRLPAELRTAIEDRAQRNFRSMNHEIIQRLTESVEREQAAQKKNGN